MEKELKFLDVAVEKAEGSERQMWFTASTEHRDRQGDVIDASGWKLGHFKKNPVFLWAHDYSRPPIGRALDVEKGNGKLRMKIEFVPGDIDPFAEQVRQLYAGGYMSAVSVGFIPYKSEELTDDDKKQRPEMSWGRRLSGELLELSAVPVPANPMALQNGFLEAVAKGMTRAELPKPADVSKLLLVDTPERVRASMLALLGARGGIPLPEEARRAQFLKLQVTANEMGLLDLGIAWGMNPDDLRDKNSDIWSGALLDVIQHAKGQDSEDAETKLMESVLASMKQTTEALQTTAQIINFRP